MLRRAVAGVVIVVGTSAATLAQDGVDLRPKFAVGQEARYSIERIARREMKATGVPDLPPQQTKESVGVLVRVKGMAEATATIDVVFERLAITESRGETTIWFDSTRPTGQDGSGQMAQGLRPAVGQVITLTVDGSGTILSAKGGEKLPPPLRAEGGGESLLAPIFGTGHIGGSAKVVAGDSWTQDVTGESEGSPVREMVTHKVAKVAGTEVRVETSGTILVVPPEQGKPAPQFSIAEQKQTGTYTWDAASGSLKELKAEMLLVVRDWSQGMDTSQKTATSVAITRQPAVAPAPAPQPQTPSPVPAPSTPETPAPASPGSGPAPSAPATPR